MSDLGRANLGAEELGAKDLGYDVAGWTPRPWPPHIPLQGQSVRMEPIAPHHAADLFAAFSADSQGAIWRFLPYGPFATLPEFEAWMAQTVFTKDPQFYVFIPETTGKAAGMAALMRLAPDHGVVEVGHITMAPGLQRTVAATQGLYLLMNLCMSDLGYRRFEWKCNALNLASRRAAERYGFTFEGVFRQSNVFKGRNRDTAWFAFLDSEWPAIQRGFAAWLDPSNFDDQGRQVRTLAACRSDP